MCRNSMEVNKNVTGAITTSRNGLFQKKIKQGELRIWNFQGYQRNSLWIFQGLIKNEVELSKATKKK